MKVINLINLASPLSAARTLFPSQVPATCIT